MKARWSETRGLSKDQWGTNSRFSNNDRNEKVTFTRPPYASSIDESIEDYVASRAIVAVRHSMLDIKVPTRRIRDCYVKDDAVSLFVYLTNVSINDVLPRNLHVAVVHW